MSNSPEFIISVSSLLVAIVAVVVGIKSYFKAKVTTDIAADDHRQRNTPVKPYLIEGFSWRLKGSDRKCFFAISLANSSVVPISIVKAELHLKLYVKEGATSQVILQPKMLPLPGNADVLTTVQPVNLAAGSTKSIWISYEIPSCITDKFKIDTYEVVFTFGNEFRISVQQYIMKEIESAEGKG